MTDAPGLAPGARLSRRLRWLLIGSLTLNLLIIGVIVGAAVRMGGDAMMAPSARSPGLGPWTAGLQRSDFRALRKAYEAQGHDMRSLRRDDRADRAALVRVLKATPFDPAALDEVAARMAARNRDRMEMGQALIRDHVLAMSPRDRADFADRLDRALRKGGRETSR